MELGKETGSLVNSIFAKGKQPQEIEVGMPATILNWSDRTPGTVISVGKVVIVQQDDASRVDQNGMSDTQEYEYRRNPMGMTFTFKKYGNKWMEVYMNEETGRWNKMGSSAGILFGKREKYYDYSF